MSLRKKYSQEVFPGQIQHLGLFAFQLQQREYDD